MPHRAWLLLRLAGATRLDLDATQGVCKTRTAASFARHAHRAPPAWTARYARATGRGPPRYLELWGRFGLLNNRLRCLANAVGFAARVDASLVLHGPWELFADGDKWDGALSRRGLWRYVRSFLATRLAVASLPDGAAGDAAVAECRVDVADDADDAAVALAAAVFADAGGDDLVAFDDFADWYTEGGYKVASWLELLDLSKWVL